VSRTQRLVTGHGTAKPSDLAQLAIGAADIARRLGLQVRRTGCSHCRTSGSRYLEIADKFGLVWRFRISNHRRPSANRNAAPHFDLVSIDGRSGLSQIEFWLGEIAAGRIAWFEPEAAPAPRMRRRR